MLLPLKESEHNMHLAKYNAEQEDSKEREISKF